MRGKKLIFWIIGVIVTLIVIVSFFIFGGNGEETYTVERGDLVKLVEVAGKVVAKDSVDLSFEKSGKISSMPVNAGDSVIQGQILARIDNGDLLADLEKARADLRIKEVELLEFSNEESNTEIFNKKRTLVSEIQSSFSTADVAIRNQTDSMFNDPDTSGPKVTTAIPDGNIRSQINSGRVEIRNILRNWSKDINDLTVENVDDGYVSRALSYLGEISSYLRLLDSGLSDAAATGSVTSSEISGFRSDVSSARNAVENAKRDVIDADDALRGSRSDSSVKEAELASARADVRALEIMLGDYVVAAPFDGVVTEAEINTGEFISSSDIAIRMITPPPHEVEVFIPEVNISSVGIDNSAIFTLDAFGPNQVFNSFVSFIDPAETKKDGISTYKTTLSFSENYPEIKPGMTANILIEVSAKSDVLIIPKRAVERKDERQFVYVKEGKNITERDVTLGNSDSKGNVEVLDGLEVGDIIVPNHEE